MKITNKFDIPEAIVKATEPFKKNFEGRRISVSELIGPPKIYHLSREHWDEIEEDASERLWALLGSAIHKVLEEHTKEGAEEFISTEIDGWKIIGKYDLYQSNRVEDYKVVSVYSFLLGDKKEWEEQLNVYAYILRKNEKPVESLWINAILRDWVKTKAYDEDYPKIPFIRKQIPLWTFEEQELFVKSRLKDLETNRNCTDEERWKRGGEFAVMKNGKKTAIKLFNTEEEAKEFIKNASDGPMLKIEKRPIIYVRCQDYCPVRKFCEYGKRENL